MFNKRIKISGIILSILSAILYVAAITLRDITFGIIGTCIAANVTYMMANIFIWDDNSVDECLMEITEQTGLTIVVMDESEEQEETENDN